MLSVNWASDNWGKFLRSSLCLSKFENFLILQQYDYFYITQVQVSVTINFHKLISPHWAKTNAKEQQTLPRKVTKQCNSGRLWLWSWVCVHHQSWLRDYPRKQSRWMRTFIWRNWEKGLAVYTRLPDSEVTSAAEMSVGVVFGRRPPWGRNQNQCLLRRKINTQSLCAKRWAPSSSRLVFCFVVPVKHRPKDGSHPLSQIYSALSTPTD